MSRHGVKFPSPPPSSTTGSQFTVGMDIFRSDSVKESKDMAMSVLNSYRISDSLDGSMQTEEADRPLPFISLMEFASTQEGASKVYELLKGTSFCSIGWATLFDCIGIYDDKFKQFLQTAVTVIPDFLEGDAKVLVAYLNVLQKVI
ncbi:hypothetical protein F2Q69_00055083 [Brassica cretica]|uniref:Uncharacterized protein n=1 Tax=Brassica cretica TaxID=69181 RepID=A0A8S9MWQ8_BRACR|nr:hypothetical protein F2Q69_00055083 [Brassica cretica]